MKKLPLLMFVLSFFLLTSSFKIKQQQNEKANELIVSFENFSPKQINDLNEVIVSLEGFKYVGFCEKMHLYYFTFDNTIYRNVENAFQALELKTKNYQPSLKIGASIQEVEYACSIK